MAPGCPPICTLMTRGLSARSCARSCQVRTTCPAPASKGGTQAAATPPGSSNLLRGGVSERPKEHASKACEGLRPPRVQIPSPPRGWGSVSAECADQALAYICPGAEPREPHGAAGVNLCNSANWVGL